MDLLTQICIYGFVVVVSLRMYIYNCLYKQFIYIYEYIYTCIHAYIHKHVFAGVSRSYPHLKRSGCVPLWHFAQGNCMVHPLFTDAPSCPSIKLRRIWTDERLSIKLSILLFLLFFLTEEYLDPAH